jgi:PadR family transcriptional regulator PadR
MFVQKDLVAASSTPLILSILKEQDSYGYAIIKKVRELSHGRLEWTEGMLYPVLHRLEEQDLVESYWHVSETGRRRKYYRITGTGREELERLKQQWDAVHGTLERSFGRQDTPDSGGTPALEENDDV